MSSRSAYNKKVNAENRANTAAGLSEINRAPHPVKKGIITRNNQRIAERMVNAVVDGVVKSSQPKLEVKMLTPEELKKSILAHKAAHPKGSVKEKSWEDYKLCKDEEDGAWRDAAFESAAKVICKRSCVVVLQCLNNDLYLGGEPGIRAGMNQDERQLQYSANITPLEISEHIYDLRKHYKA